VATAASYLAGRSDVTLSAVVFNDGWLASELRRLGVDVAVVDEGRHGPLRMVPAIARFLRARDIDIVHTHRPKDNVIGTIAAKLAGVPHVIRTVHGLAEPMRGWSRAKYRVTDTLDRVMLRCFADRIVAVSRHEAAALAGSGYPQRAIVPVHDGDRNGRALLDLYSEVLRAGRQRGVGLAALVLAPIRKVFAYLERIVRYAIEKRRVARTRKNPAELTALLQSARGILVVCHGNIIRSPFAARLIAQAIGDRRSLSIVSAGLEAEAGRPPHPTAVLTAAPLRVDLSDHTASRVAPETVAGADAIFVMDVPQLVIMRRRFPAARDKTFLLTSLAPDAALDVRDPVDGDASVFQDCYEHIVRAVRPIVQVLAGTAR
jgi:protein-tyrosine-phosphatase